MDWHLRFAGIALLGAAFGCTTTSNAEHARAAIGEPPKQTLTGKYAVVRCYFDNALPCQQALELADASYAEAAAFLHLPLAAPENPYALDFLANQKQFLSANDDLGGTLSPQHKGGTYTKSMSIYLRCDTCTLPALAQLGLGGWDRSSIAHEMLHLERNRRTPNAADYELSWIQEGAATNFEEQFMRARGELGAAEDAPVYARWIRLAQSLIEKGKLPKVDDIIHDVGGKLNGLSVENHYAVWWLFYRFMSTGSHADAFAQFIAYADGAQLRRGFRSINAKFEDTFNLDALDKEFTAYVQAQKPRWDAGSGVLDAEGPFWLEAGARTARHIVEAPAAHSEIHGEVALLGQPNPPAVVLLGGDGKACAAVNFLKAGRMSVTQLVDGKWTVLAKSPVDASPASATPATPMPPAFHRFRVELGGGKLNTSLDGANLQTELPACAIGGWGLTANPKSIAAWRAVERVVLP